MKFSQCDQYWNKYNSFVNGEDSVLFINENMQENVLTVHPRFLGIMIPLYVD